MNNCPKVLSVVYPEAIVRWAIDAHKKAGFSSNELLLLGQPNQLENLSMFRLVLDGRAEIVFKKQPAQKEGDEECGYSGA
jgi:hypothetical protein